MLFSPNISRRINNKLVIIASVLLTKCSSYSKISCSLLYNAERSASAKPPISTPNLSRYYIGIQRLLEEDM